jgi:FMN phosphatase YigB (HAD superfamily)
VHELAERAGIDHFFDFILTSAACSYRKPHPRIFEIALAHWQIKAEAAAMIGDRLDADISGAQRLGLLGIWIKRRVHEPNIPAARPDAVIETLDELPSLLQANKF